MKVGILGGSFNPVHVGHVRMAIEVKERVGLDRIELVPAKQPPHKDGAGILPFDFRMAMVDRALEGMPGYGSNPIEGERPGPSFTCDTLTCFRTERPEAEVYFILGASTFLELPNWHRGFEIPDMTSMVVVNRWEAAEKVKDFIGTNWPAAELIEENLWQFKDNRTVRLVDIPRLDIKAGRIRQRWLDGRSLRFLVPQGVEEMLEERRGEVDAVWKPGP